MPDIGKVIVRPFNRTTISSPNFQPSLNVTIDDIQSLNVETKNDGDVILYNAETGEYVSSPLNYGVYANSAYAQANTATTDAATADQRAVTSGVFANGAYAEANSKLDLSGGTVSGDVNITGNLIVSGDTVYANTTVVNLGDNIITLNADIKQDQEPTEDAGIEIDRGLGANVGIIWNETTEKWTFTNDGSLYSDIGSSSAESYSNSAYDQANTATTDAATADQRAVTSGDYANSAFNQANTATTNAATADQRAVTSGDANANSAYSSQLQQLALCRFICYIRKLIMHKLQLLQVLIVIQANTATTDAAVAQSHADAGYDQANTATTDAATADQRAVTSGDYANSAFETANSKVSKSGDTMTGTLTITVDDVPFIVANNTLVANLNANLLDGFEYTSFANSAFANIVSTQSITSGVYANAAFNQANTATISSSSAYNQANTATTDASIADQRAVTSGSYANSAYAQANTATTDAATADQKAVTSGDYANSAYDQANTATTDAATADQKAVTSGDYANSAFSQANTSTTDAATADQRAVTSGVYANSAYTQANTATTNAATADQRAVTSGDYANSAYDQANTATNNAATAQTHANAGYDQANTATTDASTADQKAVSAGSYANSAYLTANSAFETANSKVSKSGDTMTGQLVITVENSPFIVANNTLVANLNSDLLDGLHSTSFANSALSATEPNEIPLNQYLGSMAYQDLNSVTIDGGVATLDTATITSIQNDTAISNVEPSLMLNFAAVKKLDPRITFARASTGAYYDG
jgi:hypothetical protein